MKPTSSAVPIRTLFSMLLALALVVVAPHGAAFATQTPTAVELLKSSIERHDPQGLWGVTSFELSIGESRPDGSERLSTVSIDDRNQMFTITSSREGKPIEGTLNGDECTWLLDGSSDFSDDERDQYRLTCERLERIRNYYVYLWGLPMKLTDPGTRIDPEIESTEFMGNPVSSIRITYDPDVGSDTWYFYFDPADAALVGYRFYHDETAGDGEYIVLEEERDFDGLRLPTVRTWYTNQGDELLGVDTLRSLRVTR
ncbi:MAG: DUF6503 family protein [Acidobacteriota bacterium]